MVSFYLDGTSVDLIHNRKKRNSTFFMETFGRKSFTYTCLACTGGFEWWNLQRKSTLWIEAPQGSRKQRGATLLSTPLTGCGKLPDLYRARSRLYRNEILQVNNTTYAFESSRRDLQNALLCTVLESNPFSKLNFLFQNRWKFALNVLRNFAKLFVKFH